MAKKNKDRESTIENYYDLKVDKIDELVAALKGESAEGEEISMKISDCTGAADAGDKEFNPYHRDLLSRIPTPLKALFIKWWFAGLVCFFVNMGLGIYVSATLDLIVLDGLVLGIVTDAFVNPMFRFMESDKREFNWYMLFPFPFKAFWTFFANIAYYILVAFAVNYIYFFINEFMFWTAIEPLLFGVFALVVDMAVIGLKDLVVWLVRRQSRPVAEV